MNLMETNSAIGTCLVSVGIITSMTGFGAVVGYILSLSSTAVAVLTGILGAGVGMVVVAFLVFAVTWQGGWRTQSQ